jgi:CRISPR-associated protein Csm4
MAKTICYCLQPRSPFHFGERGVGMEEASVILHSDTVFSALCITLQELGVTPETLLDLFPVHYFEQGKSPRLIPRTPPFRLSSGFPYCETPASDSTSQRIFLFPKPYLRLNVRFSTDDPHQSKSFKRIQFISKPLFEDCIAGKELVFNPDHLIQGKRVWITANEKQKLNTDRLWVQETQPHVAVDRFSSASQVYGVGQVRFTSQSGLFLLVNYSDETWRPVVEKALRVLGDSGIGGERSSGKGQFHLDIVNEFTLSTPDTSCNAFTTLSLYWPTSEERTLLKNASYGFLMRHGWIGVPGGMNLRRRGVRMLTEGSVFSQQPSGALVDVKPLDPEGVPNVKHSVWRYGLAYSLPCRQNQEKQDG